MERDAALAADFVAEAAPASLGGSTSGARAGGLADVGCWGRGRLADSAPGRLGAPLLSLLAVAQLHDELRDHGPGLGDAEKAGIFYGLRHGCQDVQPALYRAGVTKQRLGPLGDCAGGGRGVVLVGQPRAGYRLAPPVASWARGHWSGSATGGMRAGPSRMIRTRSPVPMRAQLEPLAAVPGDSPWGRLGGCREPSGTRSAASSVPRRSSSPPPGANPIAAFWRAAETPKPVSPSLGQGGWVDRSCSSR